MKDKVDAIYDLREAAQEHGRVSAELEDRPGSPEARDAVLEAREKLEAATVEAIESCHHCGEPHLTSAHHESRA
jgi:hypothetical protein